MKNLLKLLGVLCITSPVYASAAPGLELSVLLGGSYIPNTIDGETLELLPYEVGPYADTFTDQSDAGAVTWALSAKYRFKLHSPSIKDYVFDSIAAGVSFYQINNFNQTGKVLQFGMPEFENYTYNLDLDSTRIMADVDLDFHRIGKHIIPFFEAGVGAANTTIGYKSDPIPPLNSPDFTLHNQSSWSFAYQVGAGFKYVINKHYIVSLHYLYANMGKVDSSTSGSATTLASPLTVDMSTQNLLFGFTFAQ